VNVRIPRAPQAIVAIAALLMAACGDDDGDSSRAPENLCRANAAPVDFKGTLPSCADDARSACGPDRSESCCALKAVKGGCFSRSYDGVTILEGAKAEVNSFVMDRFEVSVSRFRGFVSAYPDLMLKAEAGTSSYLNGVNGWSLDWPLPASVDELEQALACDETDATWTHDEGDEDRESLPINCVNYYVASAFCIWDDGRLPTEAEWNYAASGGSEQRLYPWSVPPYDDAISSDRASYVGDSDEPALSIVGSKAAGDARWGHADLAGNVSEWTLDFYARPYGYADCDNCTQGTPREFLLRSVRGGSYYSDSLGLLSALRGNESPDTASYDIGFRCVHEGGRP
jgi:sulfatase modifying factor 1